jgi:hypothetical protein
MSNQIEPPKQRIYRVNDARPEGTRLVPLVAKRRQPRHPSGIRERVAPVSGGELPPPQS